MWNKLVYFEITSRGIYLGSLLFVCGHGPFSSICFKYQVNETVGGRHTASHKLKDF